MTQTERRLFLIRSLLAEDPRYAEVSLPADEAGQKRLFRSLVNVRPAIPADEAFLRVQDEYLQEETKARGITDIAELSPVRGDLYLWRGDITTLKVGAIVNAANSGMTGCWQPCHGCIDNCIHTFAGVRLRYECDSIMRAQGHEEPTGKAKLTKGYDLPCDYVIHTVGPIVSGALNDTHRRLLESSYKSCLDIAFENGIESIAFCCISTGVFRFPKEEAARIAVSTVREFLKRRKIKVIFCVYSNDDLAIYKKTLGI